MSISTWRRESGISARLGESGHLARAYLTESTLSGFGSLLLCDTMTGDCCSEPK